MYIHVKKKDAHPSSSKRYWDEAHGVRLSMASAIPSYIKLGYYQQIAQFLIQLIFQMPPEVRSCFTSSPPKKNTRKLHRTSGSVWKSTLSDPRSLQTDGLSDKLVPNKSNSFFIMPLSKTAYGQGTYSPLSTSILMTCLGRDVPSLGLSENMAPEIHRSIITGWWFQPL